MLGDHSLYSWRVKILATTLNSTNESRDRYGRLLAYGWLGGEMLNRRLLANGYAGPLPIAPNGCYAAGSSAWPGRPRWRGGGCEGCR